jgi:hypothetical protein
METLPPVPSPGDFTDVCKISVDEWEQGSSKGFAQCVRVVTRSGSVTVVKSGSRGERSRTKPQACGTLGGKPKHTPRALPGDPLRRAGPQRR